MAAPMMLSVSPDASSEKGCIIAGQEGTEETEKFRPKPRVATEKIEPTS